MSRPTDPETPRRAPHGAPSPEAGAGGATARGGRRGLDERFRRLFDLHGEEVYRFLVRRGVAAEEARDLTQETFVRVYHGLKGFREEATARTWVFSIAQNVYRNTLRHGNATKRQGDEVPLDDWASGDRPERPSHTLPDRSAPDPFETTLTEERRELLRRAIDQLPVRMRQCVLLWVDHDLKYREIAGVLRVSIDTVKSQLHQAKERLRRALGDDDFHGWDQLGGPS